MKIIDQLKSVDVMSVLRQTGAVMEGHFKLTSGFHSKYYLQCAKLLQYPAKTFELADSAAHEFADILNPGNIDTVISPAMGGILFGYMLGLRLSKKMIFTERKDGAMQLRRGFDLKSGEKVVIAEDVITTGGSVFEVIEICKNAGAEIKGIICIVDRSENVKFDYPLNHLIKLQVEKFDPESCPLCKSGIEIYYPGSRKQ
jgi:orotate phosphoribosyltransferase